MTFKPDRQPRDAESLQLGDIALTAVLHTPGHASNCVCYWLPRERLLFTGDHVLQGVSPVILPPDGDMSAYLNSLEKLCAYDFQRIAPGHGELMDDAKEAIRALRAHRLAREAKTIRSLEKLGAADIATLTPDVYDDVSPDRHQWARLTLQAHLIKLGARRARDRKQRRLAAAGRFLSMQRVAIALRAVSLRRSDKWVLRQRSRGSLNPASAGPCWVRMAPAKHSC